MQVGKLSTILLWRRCKLVNGISEIQVCYWFAEIGASQIDPFLCTHIYYSFLGLDANGGLNHLHRSASEAENYIVQMVHLKSINPNLKVLAAIGGYNEPLVPIWSAMAANPTTRANFARNIYNFVVTHGLDGIGKLSNQLLSRKVLILK